MSSDGAILLKMRSARVPPHAFTHSLETLRQHTLSRHVADKTYLSESGGLRSYMILGGRKSCTSSLVASVMAKELVLRNRKLRCVLVPELVRPEWVEEESFQFGSGYLVVCNVGANTKVYRPEQWEDAQALLVRHLARGGGVIMGITADATDGGTFLDFTGDMLDAIDDFESVRVE